MQTRFLVLAALLAGGAAGALAQERIKPKGPLDFETVHAAVAEHWKAERWGKCFASARELLGVISMRRSKAIRDALPPAPQGYTVVPVQEEPNPQANVMLAAMTAGVGSVTEQIYQGAGKEIRVTVTADSPMLQMFSMIVQNPAMMQPNQEIVKYAECSALLETQGQETTLRLMLGESLVERAFHGEKAEFALAMFDQKAVSALHKTLVN